MNPSFTRGLLIVITCGLICKAIGAFILPAVKPAPPRVVHVVVAPKTMTLSWPPPDLRFGIARTTNLITGANGFIVIQTWPLNFPTNLVDTNPPVGMAFYCLCFIGSNSTALWLIPSNQWQFATTN